MKSTRFSYCTLLAIFGALPVLAQDSTDILKVVSHPPLRPVIVPDATLGTGSRKKDTCDLFIEEVAAAFR